MEPGATQKEIKKAYRLLALQYHPDKQGGDTDAAAMYAEIREAYETLINPSQKEAYLQQRWYQKSQGQQMGDTRPFTPVRILNETVEFNKYAASLNPFRLDKALLAQQLQTLLSAENIALLNTRKEDHVNEQIKQLLLAPIRLLHAEDAIPLLEKINSIHPANEKIEKASQDILKHLKRTHFNSRYETLVIIILTLLFCLLIYFFTR
mgnify:CR=1 FL=1